MVAEFLEARGFDVRAYEGGIREWAEAGLPAKGRLSAEQFLEERYSRMVPAAGSGKWLKDKYRHEAMSLCTSCRSREWYWF